MHNGKNGCKNQVSVWLILAAWQHRTETAKLMRGGMTRFFCLWRLVLRCSGALWSENSNSSPGLLLKIEYRYRYGIPNRCPKLGVGPKSAANFSRTSRATESHVVIRIQRIRPCPVEISNYEVRNRQAKDRAKSSTHMCL